MIHPMRLYADSLGRRAAARLRLTDGAVMPLPLDLYLDPADPRDERLLEGIRGPVLDVGCGPGRHLHTLAARGVFALGVDLSPAAAELARGRGANVVVGSIFGELPGSGSWRTALLLDGNIGIGGDPGRLLRRIGALLREDGELLVELGAPGGATGSMRVRIETDDDASSWFSWARVAIGDADRVARSEGFEVRERWSLDGRWFARFAR
jgi:SAM-dependent methyltransferase